MKGPFLPVFGRKGPFIAFSLVVKASFTDLR